MKQLLNYIKPFFTKEFIVKHSAYLMMGAATFLLGYTFLLFPEDVIVDPWMKGGFVTPIDLQMFISLMCDGLQEILYCAIICFLTRRKKPVFVLFATLLYYRFVDLFFYFYCYNQLNNYIVFLYLSMPIAGYFIYKAKTYFDNQSDRIKEEDLEEPTVWERAAKDLERKLRDNPNRLQFSEPNLYQ